MKDYLIIFWNFIKKYYIPIILFLAYAIITRIFNVCNCLVKLTIGFPCPGCGLTRACFSILRLDFVQAFKYNPLVFVIPIIVWVIIFSERPIIQKVYNSKLFWITLFIIVVTTYVLRLVFIYPDIPMDYYEHNLLNQIIKLFKGELFS